MPHAAAVFDATDRTFPPAAARAVERRYGLTRARPAEFARARAAPATAARGAGR